MVVVMLIPQAIRSKVELGFVAPFGNPWLTQIQFRSNLMAISGRFHPHKNRYVPFKRIALVIPLLHHLLLTKLLR